MRNHRLETTTQTRPELPRQDTERRAEKPEAQDILSLQRDPLAQLTCRVGDASCAGAHASELNRATDARPSSGGQSLLRLQRQYGNRYVQRVLALAKKADGEAEATLDVEEAIQGARGGGQALDSGVRAQMEPAFGANFSGVRVHTGTQADALNRSLNARAFTSGQDIFFRQGAYSPGSSSGQELLAHELTHVMQQNGLSQPSLTVSQPGDIYEQEADQVAQAVMQREKRTGKSQDHVIGIQLKGLTREKHSQRTIMRRNGQTPQRQVQPRPVQINVTSTETGTARLNPYSHAEGRQRSVVYQVPLYQMTVTGHDASGAEAQTTFRVVRFGILRRRDGTHGVVGLAQQQTHTLTWDSSYLGGSWRIYGGFLIHRGATDPNTPVGAIGCIEVVGAGEWQRFMNEVGRLSGTSNNNQIGQAGNLTVTFDAATRPALQPVSTTESETSQ